MSYEEFENLDVKKVPFFSLDGMVFMCRVIKVYDGDTITGIVKYNNNFYKLSIRLDGIDTCEKRSKNIKIKEKAIEARNRLIELIDFQKDRCCMIYIKCSGFDKYGRVLANLYKDKDSDESFQEILIKERLAYQYGGRCKKNQEEMIEFFYPSKL